MQRFSKNRQAIIDLLSSTDSHPTAEWIYEQLKSELPNLSLGTVYRNLTQLCESGVIKSVGFAGGMEHFDYKTFSHPHSVCSRCGTIIDIETDKAEDILEDVKLLTGLDNPELHVIGTCKECSKELNAV